MTSEAHVRHMHQNIDEYVATMEEPAREAWQKPDLLLDALRIRPDARIADIGAGPGYFTRRLARRAAAGWVYAVDVEPGMVKALHERLVRDGLHNVTTILAPAADPMLAPASLDLVLIVDAYHHLEGRPAYLKRLSQALRPAGRIAIVDFHKRELPVGPPPHMKLAPEQVRAEAAEAGLVVLPGPPAELLPHQYVLVFGRSGGR